MSDNGLAPSIHSNAQVGAARFELDEMFAEWTRASVRWEELCARWQCATQAAVTAAGEHEEELYATYSAALVQAKLDTAQGQPAAEQKEQST